MRPIKDVLRYVATVLSVLWVAAFHSFKWLGPEDVSLYSEVINMTKYSASNSSFGKANIRDIRMLGCLVSQLHKSTSALEVLFPFSSENDISFFDRG